MATLLEIFGAARFTPYFVRRRLADFLCIPAFTNLVHYGPEFNQELLAAWTRGAGGSTMKALASACRTWQDDPSTFKDLLTSVNDAWEEFGILLVGDVWRKAHSSVTEYLWETNDDWHGDDYVFDADPGSDADYWERLFTVEAWRTRIC